ncbi:hypothetical protein YC2023_025353 [Brassica napus]
MDCNLSEDLSVSSVVQRPFLTLDLSQHGGLPIFLSIQTQREKISLEMSESICFMEIEWCNAKALREKQTAHYRLINAQTYGPSKGPLSARFRVAYVRKENPRNLLLIMGERHNQNPFKYTILKGPSQTLAVKNSAE